MQSLADGILVVTRISVQQSLPDQNVNFLFEYWIVIHRSPDFRRSRCARIRSAAERDAVVEVLVVIAVTCLIKGCSRALP